MSPDQTLAPLPPGMVVFEALGLSSWSPRAQDVGFKFVFEALGIRHRSIEVSDCTDIERERVYYERFSITGGRGLRADNPSRCRSYARLPVNMEHT